MLTDSAFEGYKKYTERTLSHVVEIGLVLRRTLLENFALDRGMCDGAVRVVDLLKAVGELRHMVEPFFLLIHRLLSLLLVEIECEAVQNALLHAAH